MKLLFALCCALPGLMAQDVSTWQVHGQATVVTQEHGDFTSPYQGANSLRPEAERATSFTTTLMTGFRLWKGAEFYLDGEGASGKGVSSVLGMAGAPNGETYRVGDPAFHASIVRAFLRQTWDLGGETQKVEDDAHQLGGSHASRHGEGGSQNQHCQIKSGDLHRYTHLGAKTYHDAAVGSKPSAD